MQTNKTLMKSISGCMQALVTARMYFLGIRSAKAYKHFFSKEHAAETMAAMFPLWPLRQKPSFAKYTSKESKWARKCQEHMSYVAKCMAALLDEYTYRFGKTHGLAKFLEWHEFDAPKLNVPFGKLKSIVLPWKVLDVKFRRKDITTGYKCKLMSTIQTDPVEAYMRTKRDIPSFVVDHFGLR